MRRTRHTDHARTAMLRIAPITESRINRGECEPTDYVLGIRTTSWAPGRQAMLLDATTREYLATRALSRDAGVDVGSGPETSRFSPRS
ncbi:hypothetical protein I551_8962 [Mycobacterium ulcerans str. Harvey]|uniref:Uncharacterized protein n=1 Tax=Mycobacterium ulcerans str. Harvey TaxID=1299332 RepID=A0ABN0R9F4_MYCUL|nr:hypothetical protein I551_8962 [Mycobacterium ulcerans str. Harvey]